MHAQLADARIPGVLQPRRLAAKIEHKQLLVQIAAVCSMTTRTERRVAVGANGEVGSLSINDSKYLTTSATAIFIGRVEPQRKTFITE